MTVPDGMPYLSGGGHESPQRGACVMEYVSLLAGEKWSDDPACTDGALASIARQLNDAASEDDRQLLLSVIPRLIGTGGLRAYPARSGSPVWRKWESLSHAAWSDTKVQVAKFHLLLDWFEKTYGRSSNVNEVTPVQLEQLRTAAIKETSNA